MQIILEGELHRLFGDIDCLDSFDILTPAEAVRGIAANRPDFIRYLNDSGEAGVDFVVTTFDGDDGCTESRLLEPAKDYIKITPVIRGEGGRGLMGAILGVGLIAAAFLVPGGIGIFGMTISSTTMGLLGAGMLLNGLSMASQPKDQKEQERDKSNILDRSPNTTNQGRPVPIGYGEFTIDNPIVISAGITTGIVSGGTAAAQNSANLIIGGNNGVSAVATTVAGRTEALVTAAAPVRLTALGSYSTVGNLHGGYAAYSTSGGKNYADPKWLQSDSIYTAMRIRRPETNLMEIKVDFIENMSNIAAPNEKFFMTGLQIFSGVMKRNTDGTETLMTEDAADKVIVYGMPNSNTFTTLGTYTLSPGWNNLSFAGVEAFKTPYYSYRLRFSRVATSSGLTVAELVVNGFLNSANISHAWV